MKLFLIWTIGSGGNGIKRHFLSRALTDPLLDGAKPFLQYLCRRRCRLKIFLMWSTGGPFVQRS